MTKKETQESLAQSLFAIQDGRRPKDGELLQLTESLHALALEAQDDKELQEWCKSWIAWIARGASKRQM